MEMILKTTNLCKSFSGQTVVNNISLNIERNSVYGLLGPNGAGKSTTLKMITGILKPTSGNIEFDGHTWKRSDLNHIGALIEMPPLYENLTAYENLKVRTTVLGLTDKRIDEVLQIVRLTETGKKRAGQFSLVVTIHTDFFSLGSFRHFFAGSSKTSAGDFRHIKRLTDEGFNIRLTLYQKCQRR